MKATTKNQAETLRQRRDREWQAHRNLRLAVRPIRPVVVVRNGRREVVR